MFSISVGKPPKAFWMPALDRGNSVEKYPESPKIESFQHIPSSQRMAAFNAAKEQCERDREAWIMNESEGPFAFVTICEVLGVDAARIREMVGGPSRPRAPMVIGGHFRRASRRALLRLAS